MSAPSSLRSRPPRGAQAAWERPGASLLRRLPYSTLALLALLAFIQAQLWIGGSGKPYTMKLQLELDKQQALNDLARTRNEQLGAEVRDLREGLEMIEERARWELGMIKPDEILVQVARQR